MRPSAAPSARVAVVERACGSPRRRYGNRCESVQGRAANMAAIAHQAGDAAGMVDGEELG
jgi:hypothetical protein